MQAVEQYGIQSHNDELQRMFPARKLFLEGLFKLKLIRNTRLLLGNRAQQIVKGILGKEVKTSFAPMDGAMSDKAVIYLDCGDFYLIEGSHSFKIWVYLAPPSDMLTTYEKRIFSHAALTSTIPAGYQKRYGNLPLASIVHTPHTWQHKVFTFLADNGIGLDMEQLLSRQDYQYQLRRFGIPAVNPKRTPVPTPSQPTAKSFVDTITHQSALTSLSPSPVDQAREASHQPKLYEEPQQLPANASRAVNKLSAEQLSKLNGRFKYKNKPTPATPHSDEITSANTVAEPSLSELCPRVSQLKPLELKVLQYFASNAGDRARHGANVLGMTVQEINQQLYGPLGTLCWQNSQYGWHLTSVAAAELTAYEEHHKGH